MKPRHKIRGATASMQQLAEEIRRYCAAHPNAHDSIEGIAWWLAMQRYRDTKDGLLDAVDQLVEWGVLDRHEHQDGSITFACGGADCSASAPTARLAKPRLRKADARKSKLSRGARS